MKLIIQAIGIIKLIFSIIIFVGCFLAIIEPGVFNSAIRTLSAVAVLIVVVGFYLYYAIRTAIWNLFNKSYRGNVPLLIGVIIHLIFIVYSAVDFARFYAIDKAITVTPFILIGFVIGVYDAKKLYKSWNYKWGKTTSADGRVIKP